jgi:hypothetical protein
MQTERRWLKSAIAAAAQPMPALPWERQARQAPAAVPAPAAPPRNASIAAR